MTAPDKIYAWPSSTKPQGVSLAGGKVDDQIEYTRSDLIAARAARYDRELAEYQAYQVLTAAIRARKGDAL